MKPSTCCKAAIREVPGAAYCSNCGVTVWRAQEASAHEQARAAGAEAMVGRLRQELAALNVRRLPDAFSSGYARGFAEAIEAAAKTGPEVAWEVTGHKGWADLIRDHIRALVPAAEPSEKFRELPVSPAPVETQGDALTELNAALDVLQDQGIAGRPWARTKSPEAGEILYRHYKGGLYRKLYNATLEATLEPVVVYRSLKDDHVWVRPVVEWGEAVPDFDGLRKPRFVAVSPAPVETQGRL